MGMIRISNSTTATALATGQSRLLKNSSHSTLPIIRVCEPPKSEGMTNSPMTGIKTKKHPAMMPVFDRGTVINQKAVRREQPRSSAASNKDPSIRSSAE